MLLPIPIELRFQLKYKTVQQKVVRKRIFPLNHQLPYSAKTMWIEKIQALSSRDLSCDLKSNFYCIAKGHLNDSIKMEPLHWIWSCMITTPYKKRISFLYLQMSYSNQIKIRLKDGFIMHFFTLKFFLFSNFINKTAWYQSSIHFFKKYFA